MGFHYFDFKKNNIDPSLILSIRLGIISHFASDDFTS